MKPHSPHSLDIWGQFELLANLRKINSGMGRATARMLAYQIDHGVLPLDQLREMAAILEGTSRMITAYADRLEEASK